MHLETSKKLSKKLFTSWTEQDVRSEFMDQGSEEDQSTTEGANTPDCRPVYVDGQVQTDLTASDIEFMADCKAKLENKCTHLAKGSFYWGCL